MVNEPPDESGTSGAMTRHMKRGRVMFDQDIPDKPITAACRNPDGCKGNRKDGCYQYSRILFEADGVPEQVAKEPAFALAAQ